MNALEFVSSIVGKLAWPAVVVGGLLLFRREIPDLARRTGAGLSRIAGRAGSVSVSALGAKLEVSLVSQAGADQTRAFQEELPVATGQQAGQSGTGGIYAFISKRETIECAVIDLAAGESWLTTRLFLIASLAPRQRGTSQFVFTRTGDDYPGRFHSMATPDALRGVLIREDPYLDEAFAAALGSAYSRAGYPTLIADPGTSLLPNYDAPQGDPRPALGAIGPRGEFLADHTLLHVVESFVRAVQWSGTASPPPNPGKVTWVQRNPAWPQAGGVPPSFERAHWVTPQWLAGVLDGDCQTAAVQRQPDLTPDQLADRILMSDGRYVAINDHIGRFLQVADRFRLLEQVSSRPLA